MIKYFFFVYLLFPFSVFAADLNLNIEFARNDNNILALASVAVPDGYHAYSNLPGKTGFPTKLQFVLEKTGNARIFYPEGKLESDIFDPEIKVRIYEGLVHMLAVLPNDSANQLYAAKLDMLLCSKSRCMPVKLEANGKIPEKIPQLSEFSWNDQELLEVLEQKNIVHKNSILEDEKSSQLPDAAEKEKQKKQNQISADFKLNLKPEYASSAFEVYSFGKALIFGLFAGLILNIMPCVLPVLALKTNSLLLCTHLDSSEKKQIARKHNIYFASGILFFFTILAIILGSADLIWGQLFQNQILLTSLLFIVFLMGLSLFGVFSIPAFNFKQHGNNTEFGAFFSGFVCTLLATPCSGPLLGGVLAWALTQSLPTIVIIFLSIGIGMALPYLIFSIYPGLVLSLPKPGNWMHLLERILAFLLMGTALYLLAILPQDKRLQLLMALLILAFCAWLWNIFCSLSAPLSHRRIGKIICFFIFAGLVFWINKPEANRLEWQNFNASAFLSDFGQKNMLLDFTADWCPNCKYLEATVLTDENMEKFKELYNLELIKADLTDPNPYAENLLNQLGSKSIPLTALFAKGNNADKPMVLRDLYSLEMLEREMKKKFDNE